jgi:hypothetical protein
MTVERTAETRATITLLTRPSASCGSASAARYQRSEKPSQTVKRLALKLKATSTSSGACRKGQGKGGVDAERSLFHMNSFAVRLRRSRASRRALASIRTREAAEPNGQSRAVVNWF